MQDQPAILAADARVRALSGKPALQAAVLGGSLTLILTALVIVTAYSLTSETGTRALGNDFRVFWAAARLALAGVPLATFDMARLSAEHGVDTKAWMPWLYPPGYLMLILPFGAMSFANAFLAASLLSLVLVGLAVRPFVAGSAPVWIGMILAPAYLPALVTGQNSLIWLATLLAALAALRSDRWLLAGVLIGCLTLKPQLGMMIPLALLAAGLWRTILAATVTTVLLAILPLLSFGPSYWPLLLGGMRQQAERLVLHINELSLMSGPFSLMTRLGLSTETALWGQVAIALVAAVAVLWTWWSDRVGYDAKCAVLLTAILLSAPYLWYYETAMMAAIGLFLLRAGILTLRPPHLMLFLFLWVGAGLQAASLLVGFDHHHLFGALIVTPALFASLVLCLLHAAAAHRATARAA